MIFISDATFYQHVLLEFEPPIFSWSNMFQNQKTTYVSSIFTMVYWLSMAWVTMNIAGWWLSHPSEKIWVRQLGWWHSQVIWKNKSHVPNHQPDRVSISSNQIVYIYIIIYNIYKIYIYHIISSYTGWWFEPLWKIWKSIGMMTFPSHMEK